MWFKFKNAYERKNTYLYKQRKWDTVFLVLQGKDRVALIKRLIHARTGRGAWGAHY